MALFRTPYFLLLLLWAGGLRAQSAPEPLQIAERFVAPGGWPDMKAFLCCEAAGQARRQTLGEQIPRRMSRQCQLLHQDSTRAVVAVELHDSTTHSDFYLHFTREASAWKLQAVRSLSMTALGAPMLKLLTQMPPAEVARYDQAHPAAKHAFAVGNIRLWVGADADIIRHFNRRRPEFQKVVRLVKARHYLRPDAPNAAAEEQAANDDPTIQALLQSLFISRVTRRDTGLEFLIGGMTDNTVGLLYQPDAAAVPAMSPERIIVVKPIGDGWYLYKTT